MNLLSNFLKITSAFYFFSVALKGDFQVARYVARLLSAHSQDVNLVGSDFLFATEVDHWVGFASNALQSHKTFDSSMNELNSALSLRTFLVEDSVSLADIAVWATLRSTLDFYFSRFLCFKQGFQFFRVNEVANIIRQ